MHVSPDDLEALLAQQFGHDAFRPGSAHLTRDDVVRGREGLLKTPNGTLRELEAATGLSKADLAGLLGMLKKDGIVAERRGRDRLIVPDFDVEQVALEDEEERKAYSAALVEEQGLLKPTLPGD